MYSLVLGILKLHHWNSSTRIYPVYIPKINKNSPFIKSVAYCPWSQTSNLYQFQMVNAWSRWLKYRKPLQQHIHLLQVSPFVWKAFYNLNLINTAQLPGLAGSILLSGLAGQTVRFDIADWTRGFDPVSSRRCRSFLSRFFFFFRSRSFSSASSSAASSNLWPPSAM